MAKRAPAQSQTPEKAASAEKAKHAFEAVVESIHDDHKTLEGEELWKSVVEEVIASPEEIAKWGLEEPGLMLRCKEAGLVFEPFGSDSWDAIVLEERATQ